AFAEHAHGRGQKQHRHPAQPRTRLPRRHEDHQGERAHDGMLAADEKSRPVEDRDAGHALSRSACSACALITVQMRSAVWTNAGAPAMASVRGRGKATRMSSRMRPGRRDRTMTRSAMKTASWMLWVTYRMVFRVRSQMARSSSCSSWRVWASRAEN